MKSDEMRQEINRALAELRKSIHASAKEDIKKISKFINEVLLEQAKKLEPLRKKQKDLETLADKIEAESDSFSEAEEGSEEYKKFETLYDESQEINHIAGSLGDSLDSLESDLESYEGQDIFYDIMEWEPEKIEKLG